MWVFIVYKAKYPQSAPSCIIRFVEEQTIWEILALSPIELHPKMTGLEPATSRLEVEVTLICTIDKILKERFVFWLHLIFFICACQQLFYNRAIFFLEVLSVPFFSLSV